jgi:hypothetical protein
MPSSEIAAPSRPRISAENLKQHEVGDYTFPHELACEWLGLDEAQMWELVERSKLNASRGLLGPLVLVNGGQSYTLASVFFCRRLLTATATSH